ncbi:hypothetical protein CDD83_8153 [Cordyceps sp. RAO-2017]|nr:hypothetical protein CDD83_8153 [Cordyceps sp. RAO-2017]
MDTGDPLRQGVRKLNFVEQFNNRKSTAQIFVASINTLPSGALAASGTSPHPSTTADQSEDPPWGVRPLRLGWARTSTLLVTLASWRATTTVQITSGRPLGGCTESMTNTGSLPHALALGSCSLVRLGALLSSTPALARETTPQPEVGGLACQARHLAARDRHHGVGISAGERGRPGAVKRGTQGQPVRHPSLVGCAAIFGRVRPRVETGREPFELMGVCFLGASGPVSQSTETPTQTDTQFTEEHDSRRGPYAPPRAGNNGGVRSVRTVADTATMTGLAGTNVPPRFPYLGPGRVPTEPRPIGSGGCL